MLKRLISGLMMLPLCALCQADPPGSSAAELFAASRDAELEAEEEEFRDAEYRGRKYNLNTVTESALMQIPGVTQSRARSLVIYRTELGPFLHIYELQCVPGWSAPFCRKVRSYLTVSDPAAEEGMLQRLRDGEHSLSLQASRFLQKAEGYRKRDSAGALFPGSPVRLLLRYRYNNPRKMQLGFLAEKDAGEPVFRDGVKGFDHYSFFLVTRNWRKFETLALGDFRVNLGQGLVQWQSLAFNKSADIINIMRQGEPIRPNQSASESGYYRGFAASRKFGNLRALVFLSRMKRDANLKEDSINGRFISSFVNSGLHRTASEFSDRRTLLHTAAGAALNFNARGIRFGVNLVAHSFDRPVIRAAEPYNFYAFSGRELMNQSFDYALPLGSVRIFGEVAHSQPGGFGMIHGLLVSVAHNMDVALLYRNISPAYRSFESSAFTKASEPSGESGLFAGVQVKISPVLNLSAFADHFTFPFYRYGLNGVGRGSSYMVQLKLVPDKRSYCTLRYTREVKATNSGEDEFIYPVGFLRRKALRLQFGYPLIEEFSGSSRVEVAETGMPGNGVEHAILIYSEVGATFLKHYKSVFRIQVTDIPSYQSRLYAYESTGASSGYVLMHYGSGCRLSVRVKRNFSPRLLVWASVAGSFFNGETAMGSGYDKMPGRQKTQVNMQAVLRF